MPESLDLDRLNLFLGRSRLSGGGSDLPRRLPPERDLPSWDDSFR